MRSEKKKRMISWEHFVARCHRDICVDVWFCAVPCEREGVSEEKEG